MQIYNLIAYLIDIKKYSADKQNMMLFFVPFLAVVTGSTIVGSNPTQLAIAYAQAQNAPINRTMDSIFTKLPSEQDVQTIIFTADGVALTKLLQTIEIKGEEIPCDALAVYSDQIIGMIKVVLEKKSLTGSQLQVIISGAEKEIERLKNEMERLTDERDQLKLTILRNNLDQLIEHLDSKYNAYNKERRRLLPIQAQIDGYQNQIEILQRSADEDRAFITKKKLEVADHEAGMRQLQQQLANLKMKRDDALEEISRAEKNVAVSVRQIALARRKIFQSQKQLKNLKDSSDRLKKQYIRLEIEVERLRTDISIAFTRESQIIDQLQILEDNLIEQRDKLLYRELQFVNSMIRTLSSVLPRFQEQNNYIYYHCFGDGTMEPVHSGGVVIYLIRGNKLSEYLEQVYKLENQNQMIGYSYSFDNLRLNVVDPFGRLWVNTYGASFKGQELEQNSAIAKGDFTCLSPSKVRSGSGIITDISGNIIQAKDVTGSKIKIRIGACSRIEASSAIPKKGQNIVYKGVFETSSSVNLYAATCF